MSREVTVTGRDTEEEGVELGEVTGSEDGVVWLGRCVHLLEDLLRQSLCNPTSHGQDESHCRLDVKDVLVDGGSTAGGLDTALDGLSHYEKQDA